jgi:Septum formation
MGLGTSSPWPGLFPAVPCTQRHLAEVFFAGNVWPQSQTTYPGDNAVNGESNTRCLAAFVAYDGIDGSVSSFTFDAIAPSGGSDWASGDREVVWVAYEPGTSVRYSIKGSDR